MLEFINLPECNKVIEKIIKTEWDMFQKVNNIDGRAGCQDEWETFQIMRYSHYSGWTDAMIKSYAKDLENAMENKRNLVMEKYAYMMEFTQNEYYKSKLEPYLPKIDVEELRIIKEITQYMIECEKEIILKYPKLSKAGRAIENENTLVNNKSKVNIDATNGTSVETYAIGELKTYSKETLKLYLYYIKESKAKSRNVVIPVKEMMVRLYGYASLEDAENKL